MKTVTTILTLVFLSFSVASFAQFYVGGSIGNSFINKDLTDLDGGDFKIEENGFGYKVFAGFGKKFIGAEGGYRDLGKVQTSLNSTDLQAKITGWDVAARAKLNIGPIFAFAKAGAFFAKSDNQVGPVYFSENSTNFLWGLGAGLKVRRLAIRLEYESLDIASDGNLAQLMLGAAFYLGRN